MEILYFVPLKKNRMYLRGTGEKCPGGIRVGAGEAVSSDTYFGCFPCEAYAENTTVRTVCACVSLRGKGRAELRHFDASGDRVVRKTDFDTETHDISRCGTAEGTVRLQLSLSAFPSGCLYLKVQALTEVTIEGIWYEGDGAERETRFSVIICTYRREETVLKNLEILRRALQENRDLRGSCEILCVDNGGTLCGGEDLLCGGPRDGGESLSKSSGNMQFSVPAGIRLIRNRNCGGSGGYARGMMEAKNCTHFWLMDDDIRFDPVILCRALTFFRHRKEDRISLAAGMFSFERPSVQQEATASFQGYTFLSNAGGLDLCSRAALLKNEIKHGRNLYGGWWSLITPASGILPMPFFIKLDDVEYGLKTGNPVVIMNGFGVWHEAFGKKGNAWTEYYTTRNTLILQDMYPGLPHSAVKMMGIRLLKALAYGEPKSMEAAEKGAGDYAAGPAAFAEMDPETRHREIMENYRAPLSQDMSRKKMMKSAAGNLLRPGTLKSFRAFFSSVRIIEEARHRKDFPAVRSGWEVLRTAAAWSRSLRTDPAETEQPGNGQMISVIVPVYNVAEYLPQCLESLCGQTYRNLEILLVDDGSADGSGQICDEWKEKDCRIRVIHQENRGVSAARNAGLEAAAGALIGFADADDWLEPEMYARLAAAIRGADAAVTGFYDYPYGMDRPVPRGTGKVLPCGFAGAVKRILARDGWYCTLWNKLFRREMVMRNGKRILFDPSLSIGEDEVWLLQALRNCRKVVFLSEPLYHWRKREGSATRFSHVSQRQLSLLETKKKSFRLLPRDREIRELAKSKMFNDCFFLKLQAYCTKDLENYRKIDRALRPMERAWLISKDTPALRKAKVLVMDAEMKLRMPVRIVRFTDNVKKMHR